ncbi:hypothetical protein D3C75_1224140 [compost metagenome]
MSRPLQVFGGHDGAELHILVDFSVVCDPLFVSHAVDPNHVFLIIEAENCFDAMESTALPGQLSFSKFCCSFVDHC